MKTGRFTLGFAYLRLSNEEAQGGESSSITNQYVRLETLDRDTLLTSVERIEVGPKEYEDGRPRGARSTDPYHQSVRIVYKFIGDSNEEQTSNLDETTEVSA